MLHSPIHIKNLEVSYNDYICFQGFNTTINYGDRIAIIGENGTGKSSLMRVLVQEASPSAGKIQLPPEVILGYVPQTITGVPHASGAESFFKKLTLALQNHPNLLLLDEPTNHLGAKNKDSLQRMLDRFPGTLLIISHDEDVLNRNINKIWHIKDHHITVHATTYKNYLIENKNAFEQNEEQFHQLLKEKRSLSKGMVKEAMRTSSKSKNKKNKHESDKTLKKKMKETASKTAGKNNKKLTQSRENVLEQLSALKKIEKIIPTFSIESIQVQKGNRAIISITSGSVGYKDEPEKLILKSLYFSLVASDRIRITGKNASGKSTFIKALTAHKNIFTQGEWKLPPAAEMGYLDQHYNNLNLNETVFETIEKLMSYALEKEIRVFLSQFLFRRNEEVYKKVMYLSGGEKVRLSLAQISAKTPALLILDEVSNNLDITTKNYLIDVLNAYPGAIILISHDDAFTEQLNIKQSFNIEHYTS